MENPEISFRLHAIELTGKHLATRTSENEKIEQFNFNVRQEIKVNEKLKHLITFTDVTVSDLKSKNDTLAKISVAIVFEIMNFEIAVNKQEDGNFKILSGFDNLVNSISVSTCRGVLYKELSGTYLHKAYLPIMFSDIGGKQDEQTQVKKARKK